MRKYLVLFLVVIVLFLPLIASAYQSVRGYTKKNGIYVAPYVRSEPNGLKYDNYGYKPSQGLYNKTYGTRGSEWDTPTYITDPDYYVGKQIYDLGQGSYGQTYYPLVYTNTTNYASTYIDTYTYPVYKSSTSYAPSFYSGAETQSLSASRKPEVLTCASDEIKMSDRCVNKPTYCRSTYGEGYFYDQTKNNCASCPAGYRYDGNGGCKTLEAMNEESKAEAQKQMLDRLRRKGRI